MVDYICYFWTNDPRNSPSRKSEALSQAINDQHIILINILDVFSRGNSSAVAVTGVVVSTVELIHDQRRSVTANILDLCQLGVLDYFTSRVTRVGGQYDGCSTGDLLGNLVGVDVVVVRFGKGRGNCCELYKSTTVPSILSP